MASRNIMPHAPARLSNPLSSKLRKGDIRQAMTKSATALAGAGTGGVFQRRNRLLHRQFSLGAQILEGLSSR